MLNIYIYIVYYTIKSKRVIEHHTVYRYIRTIAYIIPNATWENNVGKVTAAVHRRKINDVYILWNCQFLSIGRSLRWLMTYHLAGSLVNPRGPPTRSDKSLKLPAPWIVIGSPNVGNTKEREKERGKKEIFKIILVRVVNVLYYRRSCERHSRGFEQ